MLDENNNPIPGANIIEKGTKNGVICDLNGTFELVVKDSTSVIFVSFLGYNPYEAKASNIQSKNIQLALDQTSLEEVVVVGYGLQRHRNFAGSISGISVKRNKNRNIRIRGYSTVPPTNYRPNSNESYAATSENNFKNVSSSPLSTFSIDVDRASYSNIRRFINNGEKPPKDAVRIEEMINYFEYDYPEPQGEHPIAMHSDVSACPWNTQHLLMQVGMKAKKVNNDKLPPSNLVFLIDVSGSMSAVNKLPLVKRSLKLLTDNLREHDKVAIVVYAGAAGLVLPSTKGTNKTKILDAIDHLEAGGSTAGGAGIQLAYKVAEKNFARNGNNRVILATDGDFNVGASSDKEMEDLISKKKENGIFLTCLGYGMGNYKDSKLEILADKGNGNYAYIDNLQEAQKTLVSEFGGTLFTVAKDVKIQIEFNPGAVLAYRLVGYENRLLNDEDFKDDSIDAGEIGAGHAVTALYEIVPVGSKSKFVNELDALKYRNDGVIDSSELANVKVRYKMPKGKQSIPFEHVVKNLSKPYSEASENFRFASSVALFGLLLSESEYNVDAKYSDVIELAQSSKSNDEDGYKAEFLRLVKLAKSY